MDHKCLEARALLVGASILILAVSCSPGQVMELPSQTATPPTPTVTATVEPTVPLPTAAPTDIADLASPTPASALGWTIIPVSVVKSSIGEGWAGLRVDLAVRNESGVWSRLLVNRPAWVSTAEGYTYECDVLAIRSGGTLPTGFQSRGYAILYLGGWRETTGLVSHAECKVAEQSSGYQLCIPGATSMPLGWGIEGEEHSVPGPICIDLEGPYPALEYPVAWESEVPVYRTGESIDLPIGTLTLQDVTRTEESVLLNWTFANASSGYATHLYYSVRIIGANGLVYDADENKRIPWGSIVEVGPGQTVAMQDPIEVPGDVGGLYLLLNAHSEEADETSLFDAGYVFDLTSVP